MHNINNDNKKLQNPFARGDIMDPLVKAYNKIAEGYREASNFIEAKIRKAEIAQEAVEAANNQLKQAKTPSSIKAAKVAIEDAMKEEAEAELHLKQIAQVKKEHSYD